MSAPEPVRIVLATHHPRNDPLEAALRAVAGYEVLRVREKGELTAAALAEFGAQWVFAPHWSHIIPESVFGAFPTVIFHMTDLPYGRGGSPLQNLIARGHGETMLTALRCEAGLDTGPVYLKRPLSLAGTAEEILRRASGLMLPMIRAIVDNALEPVAQTGEPTVFARRTPAMSALDEAQDAYDHIRMLDAEGYPHAFVETRRYTITFTNARRAGNGEVLAEARIKRRTPES
ncbi:methionyl-tRNA formyltransferase [Erythrobacter sp. HL-111]|uniref:methionyl-tRNA formyltransferase n=1 Tax=Erythrobacter sp. HL-111 TaxID=1798193 RepID=UPI0006DB7B25|nr:methionyl-tRNA formyltransferase [Erythrobacter sp. HL-111]KPP95467.1 MAG: methionyl-tRNA formyltransferase [Erythrobacteraceae bacterium HL-111]SDS71959.1 methionyl-tRNA formyltransferase [Erythrobacter sp. HL-111]